MSQKLRKLLEALDDDVGVAGEDGVPADGDAQSSKLQEPGIVFTVANGNALLRRNPEPFGQFGQVFVLPTGLHPENPLTGKITTIVGLQAVGNHVVDAELRGRPGRR